MLYSPKVPHNALLPLPPLVDVEDKKTLRACIDASRALAELKRAGETMPNQGLLINILPLLEAGASSRIENIVTTRDALFKYASLGEDAADPATREALSYRTALYEGFRSLANLPLCSRLAIQICSTIKGRPMECRINSGTALRKAGSGEIVYTPPIGRAFLENRLANWERYLHDAASGVDPLIRMAVAHYQFEAIHPFEDGNGRTGRVLNTLFLISEGLLDLPTLYLSRFFLKRRSDYYRLLLRVTTEADWQAWISFVLEGVAHTARWTVALIDRIRRLRNTTNRELREKAPSSWSSDLVDVIFTHPYCRGINVMKATGVTRQTAAVHLRSLCDAGILSEIKEGRSKLFINKPLMALLVKSGRHGGKT